ncbi:MAG TPA: metalloregulator ArsR/SmtB family transcription factor [bacterium]|nr:metalloregulator ArsR/SmtB family transcription factor [bacterium]
MTTATLPRRCCDEACQRAVAATTFDEPALARAAEVLRALGDPTRLKMVLLLARHEALCVCELQQAFDLGQPTVSHHLRILREAGLVEVTRRGTWAYYALRRDALNAVVREAALAGAASGSEARR